MTTVIPFPARLSESERAKHIADIARARHRMPFQVRADDRRRVKLTELNAIDALRRAGMSIHDIDAAVAMWRPG